MNSYTTLINWLRKDLGYCNSSKIPIKKLKSKLKEILNNSEFTNTDVGEKIKKKIQKAIDCEESSLLKILKEIYLLAFFSKQSYIQNLKILETSNMRDVINKRIATINYPQTLAFAVFFSDENEPLSQINRASLLIKSSLNFFLNETSSSKHGSNGRDRFSNYIFGSSFCFKDVDKHESLLINENSKYIFVMIEGYCYKFEVFKNGKPISVDSIRIGLEWMIKKVRGISTQAGIYSAASSRNRYRIKTKYSKRNNRFFEEIEGALFIVCLDLVSYGENVPEEMFSHRFRNRYFGNTQLVVGTKGESAAIISYAKIDGVPAINAFRKIFNDSNKIDHLNGLTNEVICNDVNFQITEKDCLRIENDLNRILHKKKSSFHLDVSTAFFKKMDLSTNIALNFLLMLATYDFIHNYPVINHAVSRSESQLSSAELDWIYISPEYIEKFHKLILQYPELFPEVAFNREMNLFNQFTLSEIRKEDHNQVDNDLGSSETSLIERRALLYRNFLLNQGYESVLKNLESLFKAAVSDHADKIRLAKEGLSPTFLIQKPHGIIFDELVKFYLDLGIYAPAYRNYLFRTHRNPKSIDVMTSSLRLPSEIQTLGRHGSCSDVFSCYGLHILFRENITELVFIPNKKFVDNMQQLVEKIQQWLFVIKTIFG